MPSLGMDDAERQASVREAYSGLAFIQRRNLRTGIEAKDRKGRMSTQQRDAREAGSYYCRSRAGATPRDGSTAGSRRWK